MTLTIRRVLDLSVVTEAHPQILNRSHSLEAAVRGIHVADSADLSGLLEGGELILSSGLALTPSVEDTRTFLRRLAEAGASGVIFSFLSDLSEIKQSLKMAADTALLPVILLDDRARFVAITEIAHEVIHSSTRGLSGIDAVSSFLASASVARLGTKDLFFAIADMLDGPLVLEDALSRVVLCQGLNRGQLEMLMKPPAHQEVSSCNIRVVGDEDWPSYSVISQGRKLGQIVSPVGAENVRASLTLEGVANFLGAKLSGGTADLDLLRQDAFASIVVDIRSGKNTTEEIASLRAAMHGVDSVEWYLPIAVHFQASTGNGSARVNHDLDRAVKSLHRTLPYSPCPAFLCETADKKLSILLCLRRDMEAEEVLRDTYQRLRSTLARHSIDSSWTMGVGPTSVELTQTATHGLDDAHRVAYSASSLGRPRNSFYRASDLSFRLLLPSILHEPHNKNFVRDQLGIFLAEPEYLRFIEAYLETNGNIAELSRSLHLSRPSIYARMHRIEKVLGHDLNHADVRTSLHLALALHQLGAKD